MENNMDTSMLYQAYGWTCSQCGSFVPNGCAHSCPQPNVQVQLYPNAFGLEFLLGRIAHALERIADELESEAKE